MIAIDTNILIYAHRKDSPHHSVAAGCLRHLVEGKAPWAIPWPCLHEFFSIVTHPRVYLPPSTGGEAIAQIEAWLGSPTLAVLAESHQHWHELRRIILAGHIIGPRVHDARIAALCVQHRVSELWSSDRDFNRFSEIRAINPLIRSDVIK